MAPRADAALSNTNLGPSLLSPREVLISFPSVLPFQCSFDCFLTS